MSSVNLLWAMGLLLLISQIIHIAVWRLKRPQHYLIWFSIWWLFVPGAVLFIALVVLPLVDGRALDVDAIGFWLAAYIGYLAFCGAYVHLFPAISTSSPSLEILWTLSRLPNRISPANEMRVPTGTGDKMLHRRLDNEIMNGFIRADGEQLSVTARAKPFVCLVSGFRRWIGIHDDVAG